VGITKTPMLFNGITEILQINYTHLTGWLLVVSKTLLKKPVNATFVALTVTQSGQ